MRHLTQLEKEIIDEMTIRGYTDDELADVLHLPLKTVQGMIGRAEQTARYERRTWLEIYGWTWFFRGERVPRTDERTDNEDDQS